MEYLVPALLVLILVGGFVTFMVLNATKKSGSKAGGDAEGAPGIGSDDTPLGDTDQHAGTHGTDGTTVSDPEAARPRTDDPDAAAHVARPGEGEGHQALGFAGTQPPAAELRPSATRADSTQQATEAAADAAPDEPDADPAGAPDGEPQQPASERLADRGV